MPSSNGEKAAMKWVIRIGSWLIPVLLCIIAWLIIRYVDSHEETQALFKVEIMAEIKTVQKKQDVTDSLIYARTWKDSVHAQKHRELNGRITAVENAIQ